MFRGCDIINFDESSCSREKFRQPMGRGKSTIRVHEWIISGHTYCLMAAYTSCGFLPGWEIYADTIDSDTVVKWLRKLQRFIGINKLLLFDGASYS